MVALAAPVRSFDPEWLRPRYHYGKEGLLGNYVSTCTSSPCRGFIHRLKEAGVQGGGDVTDAIFLDGAWFVGADCTPEGHCFHKSTDLVHWTAVPRRSKGQVAYDTGGLTIDDDGTPVAFSPGGGGYVHTEATDHTLEEWHGLGTAVYQDAQTPWLPSNNRTL